MTKLKGTIYKKKKKYMNRETLLYSSLLLYDINKAIAKFIRRHVPAPTIRRLASTNYKRFLGHFIT